MITGKTIAAVVAGALMATGCASVRESKVGEATGALGEATASLTQPDVESGELVADPFEPVNRAIYGFNDGADRLVLGPVSSAYGAVVPEPGRNRVRDFVDNLKSPVWLLNDLLQGEWDRAGTTAARFGLNSTVGVLGFYDFAAKHADLPKHDEDFGQTLATYGVGNGPYIVLPLLGPSTLRDTVGLAVDAGVDPLNYAQFDGDDEFNVGRRVADVVDIRHRLDPVVEVARRARDPYVEARTVYIQNRQQRVANSIVPVNRQGAEGDLSVYDDLDEFDDFEDLTDYDDL